MGAGFARLCNGELPDPRRNSRRTKARLAPALYKCDCVRLQALRGSTASVIFKEGFALGLKVRKLQAMLEALDAPNERRAQHQVPHMPVEQEEGSEFSSDEPANAVSLDGNVPVEVEDDSMEFVRKGPPHPLTHLIKEDFKPWLRIMHHPGSPDSLP